MREQNPTVFKENGSIGGTLTPTQFTEQTGRDAANKRWEMEREKDNAKELR